MEENAIKSKFKCYCEKSFSRLFHLKRHLKTVHAPKDSTLKEGDIFKEFIDFTEFLIWKEQEERDTSSMYVKQRGTETRKNGDKIFHYYCNRSGVYRSNGKGQKRLKSQRSVKIGTICPAKMTVKITNEKVVVHFSSKHENHEMNVEHLKLPQNEKEAIAAYEYSQIQNVVASAETSTTYEVTHHSENQNKSFSCNICSYSTSFMHALKSHLLVHSGERLYKCDICNRSFARPHHLKRHSLIHTGEKPYSCNVCNMSFRHANRLKLHMVEHL